MKKIRTTVYLTEKTYQLLLEKVHKEKKHNRKISQSDIIEQSLIALSEISFEIIKKSGFILYDQD